MTDDTENSDEPATISSNVLEKLDKLGENRYAAMAREIEKAREAENSIDEDRDASDTGGESVERAGITDGDTDEAETDAE